MATEHKLTYVALGITTRCSHRCDICYETAGLDERERRDGDLNTLFQIGDKLAEAGVEFVELVGGDPAEYIKIGILAHYLRENGLEVGVLSNTHFSWKDYAPYVSALEWTIHGQQYYHDQYTRMGSYQEVLTRLQQFAEEKDKHQKIGLTLNFTPLMATELFNTVEEVQRRIPVDYVQLQRVGPFGGAAGGKHNLKVEEVLQIFQQVQLVDQQLGIEIEVVDSFPICLLPEGLRKYTARCDWGYGTAYVDMYGNLSRCAVNQIPLGNVLDPSMPLKQRWEKHPELRRFREKKYLPETCQKCSLLARCGGGCPSSSGASQISADDLAIPSKVFH